MPDMMDDVRKRIEALEKLLADQSNKIETERVAAAQATPEIHERLRRVEGVIQALRKAVS